MGQHTEIAWCDSTFNPWEGCTKISPGCAACYAEARNHRFGLDNWGKGKPRRRTSAANWRQPVKWNREAAERSCGFCDFDEAEGELLKQCKQCSIRPRVFCASLSDWLDDEVPIKWLADLLKLIHDTPNLDWLLLSKRPENWEPRLKEVLGYLIDQPGSVYADTQANCLWWFVEHWYSAEQLPGNVWIGTSVEDQERTDERIPHLLKIPARVRFLSCEPLLDEIDLSHWLSTGGIHFVIAGGES